MTRLVSICDEKSALIAKAALV